MRAKRNIKQRDLSDCGPSCLASVLGHYKRHAPVSRLRQQCRTDERGTSMLGMIRTLEKHGFEAKGLEGSTAHLSSLPLPFIAHLVKEGELHHYVVVYGLGKKHYRIMDPAQGRMEKVKRESFERDWSGKLLALVPGSKTTALVPERSMRQRFLILVGPLWKGLLFAALSALLYTLLGLSSSIYLGKITDHVLVNGNHGILNLMSAGMLLLTLCMLILGTGRNLTMLRSGQVIDNQLILSFYRHLFSLPQRFFDGMKTGEILSRLGDAVKIRSFINDSLIGILVNLLTLLCSFAALIFISWKLALLLCALLTGYVLLYFLFNGLNRKQERRIMESAAELEEQLVDSLNASTHIRVEHLKEAMQEKTEFKFNHLLDQAYRSGLNSILAGTGSESLNRVFSVLLLWIGSTLVLASELSPGNLLTCYALLGYCTGPMASLVGVNKTYQNAMIAADRLFEMFDLESECGEEAPEFPAGIFGDLVLEQVSFSYHSRGSQLTRISLRLPAGSLTLVSGSSGSGKSTLAKLMAHLYPPDSGHIYLDSCDTSCYAPESLRALTGFLPQHPVFLRGSLLENLVPGQGRPDLKRLFGLLSLAGLLPLIQSLPEGLHSRVESNGMNFSGGERQRLALVRILYRNPPLYILDEPGSALDRESERLIHHILLGLKEEGKTVVLISHKKHFSALADQHIQLEHGKILDVKSSHFD